MKKCAIVVLSVLAASSLWAVEGTITTKNHDVKKGDITWQARAKKYVVTTKKGGANSESEIAPADVESIDVPQPKNLESCIKSRNIAGLKKIVTDYRMLKWDRRAARVLILALVDNDRAKEAFDTAQEIIKDEKAAAYTGEMASSYWKALLALNETQKLENCLRLATTEGDRQASAEALILRGDIQAKAAANMEGEAKMKANRKALIDGYLRAALLYRDDGDEGCRQASKEAMQESAKIFEELGNSVYAEMMRSEAAKMN